MNGKHIPNNLLQVWIHNCIIHSLLCSICELQVCLHWHGMKQRKFRWFKIYSLFHAIETRTWTFQRSQHYQEHTSHFHLLLLLMMHSLWKVTLWNHLVSNISCPKNSWSIIVWFMSEECVRQGVAKHAHCSVLKLAKISVRLDSIFVWSGNLNIHDHVSCEVVGSGISILSSSTAFTAE